MRRAATVALVVGTCLTAINHAEVALGAPLTSVLMAKIGFTYLVPFLVGCRSAQYTPPLEGCPLGVALPEGADLAPAAPFLVSLYSAIATERGSRKGLPAAREGSKQ
ncbi:MAG: nitrate/nitrite transporter NrtS [Myxococcales bacterium]|nr:nitrate/nitrite transporter NrtS [Myxococcales bacterium]